MSSLCPPLSQVRELRSTARPKWPSHGYLFLASLSWGICFINTLSNFTLHLWKGSTISRQTGPDRS